MSITIIETQTETQGQSFCHWIIPLGIRIVSNAFVDYLFSSRNLRRTMYTMYKYHIHFIVKLKQFARKELANGRCALISLWNIFVTTFAFNFILLCKNNCYGGDSSSLLRVCCHRVDFYVCVLCANGADMGCYGLRKLWQPEI